MAIELASAYVSLLPSSRGFGKELDGQLQNEVGPVGDKHGQGLGGAVIGGITKVAALGGVGAALFGGIALKSGLARLTTIQDATASLTTIMGDAGKAGVLMNQIKETVNGTPFNLDQFATAGKNLVAMNVPAAKVPGYLRAIGEAAAASGKGAEGVAQITDTFGKMAAQGKVSLDQIWSISDAGVPALQILANGFGVTTDEMQKMISNGAVPSAKAMDILTKGIMDGSKGAAGATVAYAGTMEKLRGTFNGALGGMKASIARLGASVLEPLMPFLTAGMAKFTAWADVMGKKVGPEITKLIEGVKALVGSFQSGVVDQTGFIGKMERIGVVAGNVSYALLDVWNVLVKGKFTEPIFGQGQDSKFVGVLFKIREGLIGVGGLWKSLTTGASGEGGMPTWMYTVNEKVQDLHYVLLDLKNKDFTGVKEGLRSITDVGVPTGLSLAAIGDKAGGLGNSLTGVKDKSGGLMSTLKSLGDAFKNMGSGGLQITKNLFGELAGVLEFFAHHITIATSVITVLLVAMAAAKPIHEAWQLAYITQTGILVINTAAKWASHASTIATTVAKVASTVATWAVSAATAAWTGVQWLLNAALSANPIAIVVIALVALVAGVILAYQHSETFRQIVQAAWEGIKAAAALAWDHVLKPTLDGFMAALRSVGDAAMWLWHNAAEPAFAGVQAAASFAWNSIIKPALDGFMAGLRFVGDAAMWLWHNAIEPVFAGIKVAIEVAWWAIRVVFDLWRAFITEVLVPAVMWLWHNAIEPAFRAIGDVISFVWNNVIRPTFDFLRAALGAVGDFFRSIWESVIKPAWSALGDGVRFVYDSVLVPTWNGLKAALGAVGDFFNFIWNSVIKPAWSALGDGIRFVYERVILPNWEALKAALGLVGSFFEHIWNDIIKPSWNALGEGIKFVHDQVIQPTLNRLHEALGVVSRFFSEVVGGIKSKWDELRAAISHPIEVVVGFLGDKLGGAWNAVKKILPVLPDFPKLAEGGTVPGEGGRLRGPGTGTSDSILGMNYFTGMPTAHVSDGEFVVRKRAYDDNRPLVEGINAGLPRGQLQYLAGGGFVGLPRLADGGETWPAMMGIIKGQFPWALDNSDVRPGDPGYHGRGQALDVGAPGNDPGQLAQAAAWIGSNYSNSTELIHNPNGSIKNGKSVPPSFWGAETWAAHQDHVHWANDRDPHLNSGNLLGTIGSNIAGAAGAVMHFIRDQAGHIFDAAMTIPNKAVDALLPRGDDQPGFNKMPGGMWDSMRDKAREFIVGKADAQDTAASPISGGAAPAGQINDWISQALGILNYPASYAGGLYQQAMTESGGNPRAIQGNIGDVNNASGDLAKGIMQVISATFNTNKLPGHDDIFNPVDNIIAGSRYAMGRYGADWFNPGPQHSHGYDLGGMAFGKGMMVKKTIEPERVLAPRATTAFEQMVAANFEPTSAVAQAAGPLGGGKDVTVNVYPPPGQSPEQIGAEVKRQLLFEMR